MFVVIYISMKSRKRHNENMYSRATAAVSNGTGAFYNRNTLITWFLFVISRIAFMITKFRNYEYIFFMWSQQEHTNATHTHTYKQKCPNSSIPCHADALLAASTMSCGQQKCALLNIISRLNADGTRTSNIT